MKVSDLDGPVGQAGDRSLGMVKASGNKKYGETKTCNLRIYMNQKL
jgi:hypothetical protein